MTLTAAGRLLINKTNEETYQLDVNGTGRFTGALSGTSATFSSSVSVNGAAIAGKLDVVSSLAKTNTTFTRIASFRSNEALAGEPLELYIAQLGNATSALQAISLQTGHYGLDFAANLSINGDGGNVLIGSKTDNSTGAKLQVTGAATFSSSVTAGGSITSSGSMGRFGGWYDGLGFTGAAVEAGVSGGIGYVIGYNRSGSAAIPIVFGNAGNTSSMVGYSLSFTGAATFSSTLGINGVADSVKSGTYTPTVTVVSGGATSVTSYVSRYIRVGNVVTVYGTFYYQPSGSGAVETNNEFSITLPITRTVTTNFASGTVSFSTVYGLGNQSQGYLYSTVTTTINLYAQNWYSGSGANAYYTFSYEIN
jgi:hypothetical protein